MLLQKLRSLSSSAYHFPLFMDSSFPTPSVCVLGFNCSITSPIPFSACSLLQNAEIISIVSISDYRYANVFLVLFQFAFRGVRRMLICFSSSTDWHQHYEFLELKGRLLCENWISFYVINMFCVSRFFLAPLCFPTDVNIIYYSSLIEGKNLNSHQHLGKC